MKVGDVVIYTEGVDQKTRQPIEHNALVLGERHVEDHLGKDNEPLLTLAFARAKVDQAGVALLIHGTGQTSDLVQIRLDVAHESHEYSEEKQRHYGKKQYDGGRWRELFSKAAEEAAPESE